MRSLIPLSKARLLLIICAILFPTEANAQIVLPKFSKHALLNGMEVFFLPDAVERSHFVLMIKNGAAFDPVDKWGVSYVMAQMMLHRTERRSSEQIRLDLETLGAELEVLVDWDALFFHGSAPRNRIEDTLNVLAEIVTRPRFEEELFEQLRDALIEEVRREREQPTAQTQLVFAAELFGQNPYAHSVRGNPETLGNLTLNDLKIQYRKLLMPNQAQLAVYHSDDNSDLFQALGRSWGFWIRGEAAPFTFRRAGAPARARIVLLNRPGETCLIRFGTLAAQAGAPDFYALKILQHYLMQRLPEWASQIAVQSQIEASVRLDARRMPSSIQLSIQAPTSQVVPYLLKIREVLQELQQQGVDPTLYKEARELAFLELRNALNDARGRLFELLRAHLHELGLAHLNSYGIRLDRIHPSRFQSAVQKYFPPDSFLLVVAGEASALAPELGELGSLTVLN